MGGRGSIGLLVGLAALVSTHAAQAGAWNLPKGQGEVIVKYENIRAEEFYAADGDRVDLPGGRRDIVASVFVEYGLTDRLTLQAKGEWQDGRDEFLDYQGLGPIELGVRWQAYRDDRNVRRRGCTKGHRSYQVAYGRGRDRRDVSWNRFAYR